MLAPTAESPPPQRSILSVRSMSASPETARAFPDVRRGWAAGLSVAAFNAVVVVVDDVDVVV